MTPQLTSVAQIIQNYQINDTSLYYLNESGIIKIIIVEQTEYIHQDDLSDLEKIIRIQQELNINMESMDIVINLIDKIKTLQIENKTLKNLLSMHTRDF